MPGQPVCTCVKSPRLKSRALVGLLTPQVAREDVVTNRKYPTVPIRTQAYALNGVRPVRRDMKHLLSSESRFHRALELAGRYRRQDRVGIHP